MRENMHRILVLLGTALGVMALILAATFSVRAQTASAVVAGRVGSSNVTDRLDAFAASQANRGAMSVLREAGPIEQPVHRRPDGTPTTQPPSRAAIESLPLLPKPNLAVVPSANLANPSVNTSSFTGVTGFTGVTTGNNISDGIGELEPPDQALAANNGQVAVAGNNTLRVFNGSGTALTSPVNIQAFFNLSGYNLSDPILEFDPAVQRWFFNELIWNTSTGFYGFVTAVTQTADVTGNWTVYHVQATSNLSGCPNSNCLPDYPKVGFDANGLFITADLFANGGNGSFVAAVTYVLPISKLVAGASNFTYVFFEYSDFVIEPSIPALNEPFQSGNGGTEYLLTARNIFDGSHNIRVIAIYNTSLIVSNPSGLLSRTVDVAAEAYGPTVPSSQPNVVGPYCQSQGFPAPKLDGGYNSFGANIVLANGELMGILASGSTDGNGLPRDVLAYFTLRPTLTSSSLTATITSQGYIVPGNGYSFTYPSWAANVSTGTGVIGLSLTNTNQNVAGGFPSTAIIDASNLTTAIVVGQGATSDDGFSGCRQGSNGVGRWGDYGSAKVDPGTGIYYTGNEYIPNPSQFARGTFTNWGEFITAGSFATSLTLSVSELGPGTVTSSPAGINCPGTCSANFTTGTTVSLSETPAGGWNFLEWDGACTGHGGCSVTINGNKNVMATFWQNGIASP